RVFADRDRLVDADRRIVDRQDVDRLDVRTGGAAGRTGGPGGHFHIGARRAVDGVRAAAVLQEEGEAGVVVADGVQAALVLELAGRDIRDRDELVERHRRAVVGQRAGQRQRGDLDEGQAVALTIRVWEVAD